MLMDLTDTLEQIMNWEALGALAELLGAISVFLTLIYLARQINENSKLQKISAYNAMITGFSDLYSWIGTSKELAAVSKYMFREGDRELSEEERHQLTIMYHQFGNHVLRVHSLHEEKIIQESNWLDFCVEMDFMINASEYAREYKLARPTLAPIWEKISRGAEARRAELSNLMKRDEAA